MHDYAMLAAFRRQAVQKSSIASMFEECSWIGSGQTDERLTKVVAHKEHEHHQHHRHAFGGKVAQKAKIVSIVFFRFSERPASIISIIAACVQDLRREKSCYGCLLCAPFVIQQARQMMLMMLAVCAQKPRGSDADDDGL